MLPPRFVLAAFLAPGVALAGSYSDYRSFNTQLNRAFAVPETTYTYKRETTYSSSQTSSASSSRSSSGGSYSVPRDSGNSWAMPSRQRNNFVDLSGTGTYIDPVADKMITLVVKARKSGGRLDVAKASEEELIQFYLNQGIRREEAVWAGREDYREGTRILNARYDAKQEAIANYQAQVAASRASYYRVIEQAKVRARAEGDAASAEAWYKLVVSPIMKWNGSVIELEKSVIHEATLYAAEKGVTEAVIAMWQSFRRDDPAGFIWRDRSAALGSLGAMEALLLPPANGTATDYRALVELMEGAYQTMPGMPVGRDSESSMGAAAPSCAHVLARLYAQGDATLAANPAKALYWAMFTPVSGEPEWPRFIRVARADTLPWLAAGVAASPASETALREAWEELAGEYTRAGVSSGAGYVKTQLARAEIYSGVSGDFPNSRDPARLVDALDRLEALAKDDYEARVWLIRFANRTGDSTRGARVIFGTYHGEGAYQQGLFWLNRTDGKADEGLAIHCLQKAAEQDGLDADGYLLLGDCLFNRREFNEARSVLERAPNRLGAYEQARVYLRLARMRYQSGYTTEDGDRTIAMIQGMLTPPKTEQEHAFVRELEYHRVVAPLLKKHDIFNGKDIEIDVEESRVGEPIFAAGDAPPTMRSPAQIEVELKRLAAQRANNAGQRRALFEEVLPKLQALVLLDHAEARRLWAWVVLSGQVLVPAKDIATAKVYLADAAKRGDLASMNTLGESLYREARLLREAGAAPEAAIAARYAEAADWLEAAYQNGSREVRWPLVTIYRDGLGREKTREKVLTLLESLAADEDKDARAQLTALRDS